jgi:UDP-N-acetyl-D-mannosaminuronate dehydrogenase
MGEIGKPLCRILAKTYRCLPVDAVAVAPPGPCSVLHICYPSQIENFVQTTAQYIEKYRPALTIINSTVAPGTTDQVSKASGAKIAYSPVRGKHVKMEEDLLFYAKFVGAETSEVAAAAVAHFRGAGFKTNTFPSTSAGEVAKLIETTWLGILVGWAQDIERIAASQNASYEDIDAFIAEIPFLPHGIFPGVIGGHCVMPNISILRSRIHSDFLEAIVASNQKKLAGSSL